MDRVIKISALAYRRLSNQSSNEKRTLQELASSILLGSIEHEEEKKEKEKMEKEKVEEEEKEVEKDTERKGEEYSEDGVRIFRNFDGEIIPSRERTEEEKGEKYKNGVRVFADGRAERSGEEWENGKRVA